MCTRTISPMILALASVLALGCDSHNPVQPSALSPADPAPSLETAQAAVAAASSTASGLPEFDPGDFVRVVNNPLFPLPLGTRLVYRGAEDGKPEKVVTDVTRDHKTILGVPVVVVLDRV